MRFVLTTALLMVVFCATGFSAFAAKQSTASRPAASDQASAAAANAGALVTTYCSGCHNGVMRSPSNAVLDRFDGGAIGDRPEAWARAYRQIQAGTMPPAGAPRPDHAASERLLTDIATSLDAETTRVPAGTSHDIAVLLASMLWNDRPDANLINDARRNRLVQRPVLEQHVQRMLRDDRAGAFVTRFFFAWLGLDQLGQAKPSPTEFPDFDPSLREVAATETRLFILNQLREDRDPLDLWTSASTYLNGPLARHYGIAGVTGPEFRRVALKNPERFGLLGQASILMVTSRHSDGPAYTSPAKRSVWIRTRVLGASPPHPFPGAEPISADRPITPQTRTLAAQPCRQCHDNFFPLAYTLENFDAVGRWRTKDQEGTVDASGVYVDGTLMRGAAGLRDALMRYPDALRTTVTERLQLYADGLPVAGPSPPVNADTLVRALQALQTTERIRWSSVIAAAVRRRS